MLKNAPHTVAALLVSDWNIRIRASRPPSRPLGRGAQVLALRRANRQPIRRPQSRLHVPADGELQRLMLGLALKLTDDIESRNG